MWWSEATIEGRHTEQMKLTTRCDEQMEDWQNMIGVGFVLYDIASS